MTALIGILGTVVVLATLILVHELGHYSSAKLFGVRVEEFGLGFPPRLKSWKRGGTLYSLNAVPIGGFVKMLGENGENAESDSFGAQAPWKRLLILVSGPMMNITLAAAIYFFGFVHGSPLGPLTVIQRVQPSSPASLAGLQPGDDIIKVGTEPINRSDELLGVTKAHLGQPINLLIRRGHHIFSTSVVPRRTPPPHQGPIGVVLTPRTVSYKPGKAAALALGKVETMVLNIPVFLQTVSQHGPKDVAGPIGIAHLGMTVAQQKSPHWEVIPQLVALLSVNLGVLNLLPLPALDGGRILFVLIALVRRRNVDPELEGLIHMVGMAVLLLLIALISYHDIVRWVTGGSF